MKLQIPESSEGEFALDNFLLFVGDDSTRGILVIVSVL